MSLKRRRRLAELKKHHSACVRVGVEWRWPWPLTNADIVLHRPLFYRGAIQ